MAKVPINDPKHWRERAEEARAVADAMADEKTKNDAQDCRRLRDDGEARRTTAKRPKFNSGGARRQPNRRQARRKAGIVPRANEQSNLRYSNVNKAVGAELYLLAQLLFFGRGLIGRCN
jgi:hypothetical protein